MYVLVNYQTLSTKWQVQHELYKGQKKQGNIYLWQQRDITQYTIWQAIDRVVRKMIFWVKDASDNHGMDVL